MARDFFVACEMRAHFPDRPVDQCGRSLILARGNLVDKSKTNLSSTRQLNINLRQQLRIKQSAMLHSLATIDAEAATESVEAVLGAGVAAAGHDQGANHPAHAHRIASAQLELAVEKAEIKPSIMRNQGRIAEKF